MKHTKSKTKTTTTRNTQVSRIECLKHFIFQHQITNGRWMKALSIRRYGVCASVCAKLRNLKRQSVHYSRVMLVWVWNRIAIHLHVPHTCSLPVRVYCCFHYFKSENNFIPTIHSLKKPERSEVSSKHNSWN